LHKILKIFFIKGRRKRKRKSTKKVINKHRTNHRNARTVISTTTKKEKRAAKASKINVAGADRWAVEIERKGSVRVNGMGLAVIERELVEDIGDGE